MLVGWRGDAKIASVASTTKTSESEERVPSRGHVFTQSTHAWKCYATPDSQDKNAAFHPRSKEADFASWSQGHQKLDLLSDLIS